MFNKKQNDAWCTSTKTNDHCSKDLVDHQGMLMTKASKNAPVIDVLHAVETWSPWTSPLQDQNVMDIIQKRNLQPATKTIATGKIRQPFHCNPSDKYNKINTRLFTKLQTTTYKKSPLLKWARKISHLHKAPTQNLQVCSQNSCSGKLEMSSGKPEMLGLEVQE